VVTHPSDLARVPSATDCDKGIPQQGMAESPGARSLSVDDRAAILKVSLRHEPRVGYTMFGSGMVRSRLATRTASGISSFSTSPSTSAENG
jgi:hypothetical protein